MAAVPQILHIVWLKITDGRQIPGSRFVEEVISILIWQVCLFDVNKLVQNTQINTTTAYHTRTHHLMFCDSKKQKEEKVELLSSKPKSAGDENTAG